MFDQTNGNYLTRAQQGQAKFAGETSRLISATRDAVGAAPRKTPVDQLDATIVEIVNGYIGAAEREGDLRLADAFALAGRNCLFQRHQHNRFDRTVLKDAVEGALQRHSAPYREQVFNYLDVGFDRLWEQQRAVSF